MKTKAEMGVGTLIIFIAMLLVAAVAAGVLLQTASSLQQKALETGQQAKGEISTNVRVVEISAIDGLDAYIDEYTMQVKLAPGSDPIKFSDATLTVSTDTDTTTYAYSGFPNVYAVDPVTFRGTFAADYLINGSNHVDGNLARGDLVKIVWTGARTVGEDEHLRINFIPKTGTPTLAQFNTPDIISTERVYLYP